MVIDAGPLRRIDLQLAANAMDADDLAYSQKARLRGASLLP